MMRKSTPTPRARIKRRPRLLHYGSHPARLHRLTFISRYLKTRVLITLEKPTDHLPHDRSQAPLMGITILVFGIEKLLIVRRVQQWYNLENILRRITVHSRRSTRYQRWLPTCHGAHFSVGLYGINMNRPGPKLSTRCEHLREE